MMWKRRRPTPKRPTTWTWSELLLILAGLTAVALVAAAFYYGFGF